MRAFVTGGQGFVGTWLQAHLRESGDEVDVAVPGLDIGDVDGLRRALVDAAPDAVYHLAAFTHVGQSWGEPQEVFRVNAGGTLNLLEAARRCPSPPRVLLTSSAEVYGAVKPEYLPLTEGSSLLPVSPYAASKVAAEFLGVQAHLGHGLPVIRARSFNHVGPGQAPSFAVSALAKRIVEAERAGGKELRVGNLRPRRDFTDVRDVVRAYRLLILRGEAGAVYNVCSGIDVPIEDVAHRLLAIAGSHLDLIADPSLERPADVPVLRGDSTLLRSATGWRPEIPLDATLRAVLDHWRAA
ncbi:MAG TPA: GDP-mannose 4,6-dehydratase [Acidimicrobiales bacterium]